MLFFLLLNKRVLFFTHLHRVHLCNIYVHQISWKLFLLEISINHVYLRNIPDPTDADSECSPNDDDKEDDAAIKLSYTGLLYPLSRPPPWVAASSRASIDESRLSVPSLENTKIQLP